MIKPLSIADINALRVLLNKAHKPAPMTKEQKAAKRIADREAYRAIVLTWAIQDWHQRVADLKLRCPDLWTLGAGDCPTVYSTNLNWRYKSRNT